MVITKNYALVYEMIIRSCSVPFRGNNNFDDEKKHRTSPPIVLGDGVATRQDGEDHCYFVSGRKALKYIKNNVL